MGLCVRLIIFYQSIIVKQKKWAMLMNQAYNFTHLIGFICGPIILMFVCSALVAFKYPLTNLGSTFSRRRKCILRLTFALAISHLVFEGPASCSFLLGAIYGSSQKKSFENLCIANVVTNFLTVFNAAIPFYLFLIVNRQFREFVKTSPLLICILTR